MSTTELSVRPTYSVGDAHFETPEEANAYIQEQDRKRRARAVLEDSRKDDPRCPGSLRNSTLLDEVIRHRAAFVEILQILQEGEGGNG